MQQKMPFIWLDNRWRGRQIHRIRWKKVYVLITPKDFSIFLRTHEKEKKKWRGGERENAMTQTYFSCYTA